jgi:Na+-translocating ferredoxin:NAD+ oxidoreductase subunit G
MDIGSSLAQVRRYSALAVVLAGATAAVAAVAWSTQDRIQANQVAWLTARLHALVPEPLRDNKLHADAVQIRAPELAAAPVVVYRARRNGKPTAVVMTATAQDGYGGPIELLVAIDYDGRLLGVDVLRHNETPGIGENYLPQRTPWLARLAGRSLHDPEPRRWTIAKDGGEFDFITGASITPRAMLKSIRLTLEYQSLHRQELFDAPAGR